MSDETTQKNKPAPALTLAPTPAAQLAPLPFDDAGALGRFGNWLLGPSWRTTLASAGVLVGTVVVVICQSAPDLLPAAIVKYAPTIPLIAAALGLRVAKDVQTSGVARTPSSK